MNHPTTLRNFYFQAKGAQIIWISPNIKYFSQTEHLVVAEALINAFHPLHEGNQIAVIWDKNANQSSQALRSDETEVKPIRLANGRSQLEILRMFMLEEALQKSHVQDIQIQPSEVQEMANLNAFIGYDPQRLSSPNDLALNQWRDSNTIALIRAQECLKDEGIEKIIVIGAPASNKESYERFEKVLFEESCRGLLLEIAPIRLTNELDLAIDLKKVFTSPNSMKQHLYTGSENITGFTICADSKINNLDKSPAELRFRENQRHATKGPLEGLALEACHQLRNPSYLFPSCPENCGNTPRSGLSEFQPASIVNRVLSYLPGSSGHHRDRR